MKKIKYTLSLVFRMLGLSQIGLAWLKMKHKGNYIRVINYHSTPASEQAGFEKQLTFFQKHFSDVNKEDLDNFYKTKKWNKSKPGLMITFDDGLKNNFTVAKGLLEKYNFTGWFCIPSKVLTLKDEEMENFMFQNKVGNCGDLSQVTPPMKEKDLLDLAKNHVVVSHTRSHHFVNEKDSKEQLQSEMSGSKADLEQLCGQTVDMFCWVGGGKDNYSTQAATAVREAGYRYSLMTCSYPLTPSTNPLQIHRTNIETHFPLHFVQFSLSGAYDALYHKKRTMVNELTKSSTLN